MALPNHLHTSSVGHCPHALGQFFLGSSGGFSSCEAHPVPLAGQFVSFIVNRKTGLLPFSLFLFYQWAVERINPSCAGTGQIQVKEPQFIGFFLLFLHNTDCIWKQVPSSVLQREKGNGNKQGWWLT